MALHAKILKHNILRVSKLRKLSHTTQAVDVYFEKCSSAACRLELRESAGQCDACHNESVATETSCSAAHKSLLTWCTRVPDLSEVLLPYQHPSCHLRHSPPQPHSLLPLSLSPLSLSSLETLLLGNNNNNNQMGQGAVGSIWPHDTLSSMIKPVSYSADDIFIQPSSWAAQDYPPTDSVHDSTHTITFDTGRRHSWSSGEWSLLESCASETSDQPGYRDSVIATPSPTTNNANYICDFDTDLRDSEFSLLDKEMGGGQGRGDGVLMCKAVQSKSQSQQPQGPISHKSEQGPNLDMLRKVEQFFIETMPDFFRSRMDYRIYHPDVVFENNFWGKNDIFVGVNQYAAQMMKLRALTHLKYAHVHMELVSSACVPEEGVVRIQWRIVGLSQLKALKFWKYTAWSYGKSFREDAEWVDGISILHVNKDGLVVKHRMDRVMPDEDMARTAPTLATKLAVIFGLMSPKTGWLDCSLLARRPTSPSPSPSPSLLAAHKLS